MNCKFKLEDIHNLFFSFGDKYEKASFIEKREKEYARNKESGETEKIERIIEIEIYIMNFEGHGFNLIFELSVVDGFYRLKDYDAHGTYG